MTKIPNSLYNWKKITINMTKEIRPCIRLRRGHGKLTVFQYSLNKKKGICRDRMYGSRIPLTHCNTLIKNKTSIGCKWFCSKS